MFMIQSLTARIILFVVVAALKLDWSIHSELNTTRCKPGAEKILGSPHLVGNFKKGAQTAEQGSLDYFDPVKADWVRRTVQDLSNNGGCTVQVSPTDIVVVSKNQNPGNLPFMHRFNFANGGFKKLQSPPLHVRD